MHHYRTERAEAGDELMVGFYGGAPPTAAQLRATGDLPVAVRVRPDLLSREDAERLVDAGTVHVELDALTFDDSTLARAGRRYPPALVEDMLEGLASLGVRTGIVLAPGLPGTDFDTAVADARRAGPLVDTARLHPVLVLEHSRLHEWHLEQIYEPLTLGEAVTVCRAMLDELEAHGVEVIRVGLQPRPDGAGRALAGPAHPALRQLVEARRVREHLLAELDGTPPGKHIVIKCAPRDETRTRGPRNQHIRDLRAAFGADQVEILPDPDLVRGEWAIEYREEP